MEADTVQLLRSDGVSSKRYFIAAWAVWMSSFSIGTCYGYSAPAKKSMIIIDEFPISESDFSWLASVLTLGGLAGGLTGGIFSERIGRRWTLILACLGVIVGWQTMVCAFSVAYLLFGRMLCGYWIGVMSLVGPVYLSEVSPSAVRGRLSSAIQFFIVSGLLSMYVVAKWLTWKWLAIFGMVVPAITVVLLLMSVESPAWCFDRQLDSRATRSLLFLWGDCDQVTNEILRHERRNLGPIAADTSESQAHREVKVLEPIALSVLLMIAQQGCGINAVVFYAEDIFHKAGTTLSAYDCMVGFGFGQVIGSILNMAFIERFGRRFLLITSSIVVTISLYLMAFYFVELKSKGGLGWVPISIMSVYTIAFAVGLGPVAWIMMGEILPMKCRSYGSVLATSVNWAGAFLVTNQWSNLQSLLTTAGAYSLFASISLILLIILVVKLPETKGRSLAEIEGYFVKLRRVDQSVESSIGYPSDEAFA